MGKTLLMGFILLMLLHSQDSARQKKQRMEQAPTATVEVVAFEANGRFLGAPNVSFFAEPEGRQNLAAKFRGGVATGIPYGIYRIEGRLPWYYSDVKLVGVYQPVVTVVLGLRFAEELPQVPPILRGRVVGLSGSTRKTFTKLLGVYENLSVESAIASDGGFSLGGLSPGLFLLLVVGEKGILASQTVTIPYTGPPLDIQVRGDHLQPLEK